MKQHSKILYPDTYDTHLQNLVSLIKSFFRKQTLKEKKNRYGYHVTMEMGILWFVEFIEKNLIEIIILLCKTNNKDYHSLNTPL